MKGLRRLFLGLLVLVLLTVSGCGAADEGEAPILYEQQELGVEDFLSTVLLTETTAADYQDAFIESVGKDGLPEKFLAAFGDVSQWQAIEKEACPPSLFDFGEADEICLFIVGQNCTVEVMAEDGASYIRITDQFDYCYQAPEDVFEAVKNVIVENRTNV